MRNASLLISARRFWSSVTTLRVSSCGGVWIQSGRNSAWPPSLLELSCCAASLGLKATTFLTSGDHHVNSCSCWRDLLLIHLIWKSANTCSIQNISMTSLSYSLSRFFFHRVLVVLLVRKYLSSLSSTSSSFLLFTSLFHRVLFRFWSRDHVCVLTCWMAPPFLPEFIPSVLAAFVPSFPR